MTRTFFAVWVIGCSAPAEPPITTPAVPMPRAVLAQGVGGPDFRAVFKTLNPSVVGIVAGRTHDGRFQPESPGTGLVWDVEGHIVTNDHLIADAEEIRVRDVHGRVQRATLVGNDGPTDVAVLKVATRLPPAKRGHAKTLEPGTWVAAIGNPYGMQRSITVGVVSAVGRRNLPPGGPRYGDFIQADLNVNPGNSGGPIVNAQAEVVGLATATLRNAQGMAFAAPIERVELVVGRLLRDGRFVRSFAGLYVKKVAWSHARKAGLKRPMGARVWGTVLGGPAGQTELKPGDIILEFDGKNVENSGQLPWLIAATAPNTQVKLKIARGSKRLIFDLTVTEAK